MTRAERLREARRKRIAAGICPRCGKNKIEEGYKSCAECRKKDRDYWKKINGKEILRQNYWMYRNNGVCVKCHNRDAAPGRAVCDNCHAKIIAWKKNLSPVKVTERRQGCKEAKKKLYDYRKANGLCVSCGKEAIPGMSRCIDCRLYHNQWQNDYMEQRRNELKKNKENEIYCHQKAQRMGGNAPSEAGGDKG